MYLHCARCTGCAAVPQQLYRANRPLTEAQTWYAANDALVLLRVYDAVTHEVSTQTPSSWITAFCYYRLCNSTVV
jgi:ribonuclease D